MMTPNPDQSQPQTEPILARWRESYGWWSDEPYREVIKTLDAKGKVHREEKSTRPAVPF